MSVSSFFPDRKFDAFLFDFDGTVADTMPVHFTAWNKALEVYKLTLTLEQHHGWAGRPTREIIKLLSDLHKIDLNAEEILKNKEVQYLTTLAEVRGIVPVVEIIRASYGVIPMAIVSGSRRKAIERTLNQLNMASYFQVIVGAEDYVNGKPAPDCFLKAAELLKVKPENCLAFEDAVLGIQSARAAGMPVLRVVVRDGEGHEIVHDEK